MSSAVNLKSSWLLAISLNLAAWAGRYLLVEEPAPPPRLIITTFDDQGAMLQPDRFNQQLRGINPTQVLVASHG